MSGVNEIRSTFLNFFAREGHEIVPSSSLIPRNDPTLMFTNAGMVQFKNIFTGIEKSPYQRAVTSQKCVRAGGKHNDLDNVGYTMRHHTFFEMLGNFSFGDYFKEDAIDMAWRLLTQDFGLPKEKLLVTVYHEDEEASAIWRKVAGLPDSRIIRISTSDNFWQMGDTGPCGPCSEIFYDHGDHIWGGPPGSADQDGDRFIEIWNLVFMQYEQLPDGSRIELPKRSIDTGMGLERISAVLQGTPDNYATDLMRALIGSVENFTDVSASGEQGVSHRIIADHLRSSAFLVADGVLPSNEGRGYVLRRIMRRAMRHAQLLGAKEPLMWQLVPTLIREMGQSYPELIQAESLISDTLSLEETRFRRTLSRGLSILDEESSGLQKGQKLSGDIAFTLYDTYGFPLDLTQDALKVRGIEVDTIGFDRAMEKQREKARAAWKGSGEATTETVWFAIKEKAGATEFLGYDTLETEATVLFLIKDGQEIPELRQGETGYLVTNQTPFYGESGGQVGDKGHIRSSSCEIEVLGTEKKFGDLYIHHIRVDSGSVKPNQSIEMKVDAKRRIDIARNHSATHLLHEALREVLGDHVAQKGSLVSPDRLRFDFSHTKAMSEKEIAEVEELANTILLQNLQVTTHLKSLEDAISSGARALFGEKYSDEVRVVTMGKRLDKPQKDFSVELCGGTHVKRTGDIGLISIVSESGVAAGVRRLEALTGSAARQHAAAESRSLQTIAALIKSPIGEAPTRIKDLLDEKKSLERELTELKKKLALGSGGQDGQNIKTVNGLSFIGHIVQGVELKDLKGLVDEAKKRIDHGIVAFIGLSEDGKAGAVIGVVGSALEQYDAVTMVRKVSEILGGKGGGGRPDLAQAGGPEGNKAQEALDLIEKLIEQG